MAMSKNMETYSKNIMWMVPRSVSTAIMKSMSRVPGIEVWLEPYGFAGMAAGWMKHSRNEELPPIYEGSEAVYDIASELLSSACAAKMTTERLSYNNIKRALEQTSSKYVFVKDESFAMRDDKCRRYLPTGYRHSFLIRHPTLVYSSMHKATYRQYRDGGLLLEGETDECRFDLRNHSESVDPDVYFKSIHSLWKYVRENLDPFPVIIDSTDLLSNPAEMMPKYCEAIGLPFSESLLDLNISIDDAKKWNWPAEDLVHDKSHLDISMSSVKFHPPKDIPPRDQLFDDVIELSEIAMPYYQEMYENRLKV